MEFFNDIGSDLQRPSLFELVAQEQLRDLLQPALKYVLAVFAQRHPRYLLRIVNRHEEFYALIMFFVERHYLKTESASFAEAFYGLKRRRKPWIETERSTSAVGSSVDEGRLRSKDIWKSLVFLIGIPYLKAKAQDYYEQLGGGVDSDLIGGPLPSDRPQTLSKRLGRLFKTIYPWAATAFELWLVAWNIAYLFDKTPFYRPWLAWIGVDVRRLGAEDMLNTLNRSAVNPKLWEKGNLSSLKRLLTLSHKFLLNSLKVLLPTAIFFIKFLEWWYSPSSPARTLSRSPSGPAIPPPHILLPHPQGLRIDDIKYGECAICRTFLVNPTALPSGYVFCYRCAYTHVENKGTCPVTLLPAKIWQLRKILVTYSLPNDEFPHQGELKDQFGMTHFGKQILAEQIPGWSQYYLDYKFLKKIVSSLSKSRPAPEAAALAIGIRPGDLLGPTSSRSLTEEQTSVIVPASSNNDDERSPNFQAYKAAFFFKLERELEKINAFYLQKEAELKLRLETLLSKRKAAASRFLPEAMDETLSAKDHVEWRAVEEGFRLLERDLAKLQHFVEINAVGFRKILKKWDKRSKSTTKELYLARQVEVQPVFNRQLLAMFSNTVTDCLVDITNVNIEPILQGSAVTDVIFSHQVTLERTVYSSTFNDLESNLRKAVSFNDEDAVRDLVRHASNIVDQEGTQTLVNRILWKAAIEATPPLADIVMTFPGSPFDFHFIDDINGRTCLHEAAIAGEARLVDLCVAKGVHIERADVYGRSALHYASMNGHADVCKRLLATGIFPDGSDMDDYSPLIHAIICGSVECVKVLLADSRVSVTPVKETGDISPLSLACQFGRVEIALLLTERGAKSLPNSNGEYPMHLAAREGHPDVCKLLIDHEGYDTSDKYNEWTPLFHAAANGHEKCLKVLIDAGCKAYTRDEISRSAVFYAAWNGHLGCVNALLAALARSPGTTHLLGATTPPTISPLSDLDITSEGDADHIPSLSLPPPIIPFRVYGHNYLDKSILVQVTLGHPLVKGDSDSDQSSAIHLIPRIVGARTFEYPQAAPSLKLVMASLPDKSSAHHTIAFPLTSKSHLQVFTFQMQSLADFSLEFSVYPSFGSKTLGRAVALPATFRNIGARSAHVLPVLDHRLHVIGQISYEVSIITPFHDATLEIGGAVETYWKSTAPKAEVKSLSELKSGLRVISSAHTSPSIHSPSLGPGAVCISSLRGDYVHAVIQVTRDLIPVVFSRWTVPLNEVVDLGVADLTLAQLVQIATKEHLVYDPNQHRPRSPSEWARILSTCLMPLKDLLHILPSEYGISLELAYATPAIREDYSLSRSHDLNIFVDSVLSMAYNTLIGPDDHRSVEKDPQRRKLVFSSFAPDVCAALNWKQPNYAVFFASDCGVWAWPSENDFVCSAQVDRRDRRCKSTAAAVDFAKWNNLLGLLINSTILTKVPSLVQGIRDSGLLLAAFGSRESASQADLGTLDALMQNGVLTFIDHTRS
ncbi:cyclin-dependent protein kinase inhibitor [Hysterangium stoloniferum]|nr:cyclin-dependent protein kinase inhibitor [Hysterangium stoloniferum]